MKHQLYRTGDADAPESILDQNGEVALDLCRICNKAEAELKEVCLSTREQALEWWSILAESEAFGGINSKQFINEKYYPNRDYSSFTGREIEEIWRKEVSHNNSDVDEHFSKLNQKQYTERDLELAYCIGYLNQRDFSMELIFAQSKELKHKFNLCKKFIDDQKV